MKYKELKECPMCGGSLRTMLTNGRLSKQVCRNYPDPDDYAPEMCGWESEPFQPAKRPVSTVRTFPTGHLWVYEGFDARGQPFVYSQGFSSEAECRREARKEIQRMSKIKSYGKCVAVIWPPSTKLRGKLVKA